MIAISKFEISPPPSGTYGPWRDAKERNSSRWYAGEIISITNSSFNYDYFTDVVGDGKHYSGSLKVYGDHIFLDHPAMCYPYRVSGKADGIPVLLTWEGYEEWKKTRKVFMLNILYFQKQEQKPKMPLK